MPDDEETTVRQRLVRLFDPVAAGLVSPVGPASRAAPTAAVDGPGEPVDRAHESGGPVDGVGGPGEPWSAPARGAEPRPGPAGRLSDGPAVSRLGDRSTALPSPGQVSDGPAVSRLPGPGAFDPGRRGVRALAAVAAVVVLVAAVWAWRSRPRAEPVRPVAATAEAAQPAPAPSSATSAPLVVAVAGKVRRPGLVRLPAGARVGDAIEAAGGALPGVDVALLNPARKVTDGELILVGVTAPPVPAGGPGAAGTVPGAGGAAAPAGPVNLNTATLAQLDALPGVGPVLAQRILDHRERHGGFRSVSDLRQVDGIGDARYEQLKDLVTV
ncbi:helix-hairpin-helix domain-containing protein [Micromonospora sp. NPDC049836]|uniref:helix-hairpin-helix domain-containing protein n=1 Tax=Micromonospora sp. NPDC049836 TaxID=3364274 RepID=UPI0037AC7494